MLPLILLGIALSLQVGITQLKFGMRTMAESFSLSPAIQTLFRLPISVQMADASSLQVGITQQRYGTLATDIYMLP